MSVIGEDMPQSGDSVDAEEMTAELDQLQRRLDALARQGTNPYEIRRLQCALDAARAQLVELLGSRRSVAV